MQDVICRRKAYIILAVVFGLMLIFFLGSIPGGYKEDTVSKKDKDTSKKLGAPDISSKLKSSQNNVQFQAEDKKEPDQDRDEEWMSLGKSEESENIPFNKGNIAQKKKIEYLMHKKDTEGEYRVNSKQTPARDKTPLPDNQDQAKEVVKLPLDKTDEDKLNELKNLQVNLNRPSKDDRKRPPLLFSSDYDQYVKPEMPTHSVNRKRHKVHTHRKSSIDELYVRSSMPLGHALNKTHTSRQKAIVDAFKHAWKAYKTYAWGYDELRPLSKTGTSVDFGLGMTIIDSLDTIWLMGLQEEFDEARNWVATSLNLEDNYHTVSLFETNIRVLGGLLGAYHLSQDEMFLEKAVSCLF